MMAFVMKLNEARIGVADFNPLSLDLALIDGLEAKHDLVGLQQPDSHPDV